MDKQLSEWDRIFLNCGKEKPEYDDWLEKYRDYLDESKSIPIIDLGCGFGNDTLYLTERGYKVISCDYSMEALDRLKYFIPNPETRHFNMLEGLPFKDNSTHIIIADLSLHYFSWNDTRRIVNDIFRVLDKNGYLLCRINSIKDVNHGAGQGVKIEDYFYNINGKSKRFFDEEQILKVFKNWEILNLSEYEMRRYKDSKIVWEIALKNNKE